MDNDGMDHILKPVSIEVAARAMIEALRYDMIEVDGWLFWNNKPNAKVYIAALAGVWLTDAVPAHGVFLFKDGKGVHWRQSCCPIPVRQRRRKQKHVNRKGRRRLEL